MVPSAPSASWNTNAPPVRSSHQVQQVSPSYWSPPHPVVTYAPVAESVIHQASPTQYGSQNFPFQQDSHSWAPPTRSMSFGTIEGMPQQYPYHELQPQHGVPGPLPSFHFAPHPQHDVSRLPSSESHHLPVTAPGAEQPTPLPPFHLQKSWSTVESGPNYSSTGEPTQQPTLPSNAWYPHPPQYGHSQQYYHQSSHPG
jgi:hypothetical protein